MSHTNPVADTVVNVEPQPAHIDTFPYNKLVIESKTKLNMFTRCAIICAAILVFGGAIAAGVIVGVDKSSAPAPAPASLRPRAPAPPAARGRRAARRPPSPAAALSRSNYAKTRRES